MRAYVLINVKPGYELEIIEGRAMSVGISSLKGVVQADVIRGSYDIIAVVEGEPKTIDETILKIRKIPNVTKTESLLAFVQD
jgi:hypothetical protein